MARRKRYWTGFATGAAAGAAASLGILALTTYRGAGRSSHVLRLEESIQIGRPVEEVFSAWVDFERLPQLCETVRQVTTQGNRSHWVVQVESKRVEWDSEIQQFIPNQAVGWKSLSGPKHTGRINFSALGEDTLVHVTMNYAPPSRLLRPFMHPMTEQLQGFIKRALQEFKSSLEGKGKEGRMGEPMRSTGRISPGPGPEAARGTGTFGSVPDSSQQTQHTRFGGPANPVDYTAPPEAKR